MFGYNGPFTATARGLVPATTFDGSVTTTRRQLHCRCGPDTVSSPWPSRLARPMPASRCSMRMSARRATSTCTSSTALRRWSASSGGGTSAEEVNLLNPAAATYTVWVHGFADRQPVARSRCSPGLLGRDGSRQHDGSAPATATLGATGAINLTFSGLTAGTKYLGSVAYGGAAGHAEPDHRAGRPVTDGRACGCAGAATRRS